MAIFVHFVEDEENSAGIRDILWDLQFARSLETLLGAENFAPVLFKKNTSNNFRWCADATIQVAHAISTLA